MDPLDLSPTLDALADARTTLNAYDPVVPLLVTPAEAAALLAVSVEQVWEWCRLGRLPRVKMGHRTIRIRRSDLAEFIRQCATV